MAPCGCMCARMYISYLNVHMYLPSAAGRLDAASCRVTACGGNTCSSAEQAGARPTMTVHALRGPMNRRGREQVGFD